MNSRIKKASKITAIAAALLLSLGLLTSSPAQAAEVSNGFLTTNGFSMNGFSMNGWSMNGWSMNGWAMNGLSPSNRPVSVAAIWAAHGIDPRQPLSTTVERVGR